MEKFRILRKICGQSGECSRESGKSDKKSLACLFFKNNLIDILLCAHSWFGLVFSPWSSCRKQQWVWFGLDLIGLIWLPEGVGTPRDGRTYEYRAYRTPPRISGAGVSLSKI